MPNAEPGAINRASPDGSITASDGGPDCPYCRNMRFVINANNAVVPCPQCSAAVEEAKRLARTDAATELDQFGSALGRAASQTFFNFNTTLDGVESKVLVACLEAAKDFAEHQDQWLVIYGRSGNGKSHLAAAVHNHVVNMGTPAIYITVPDMFYKLRRLFSRDTLNGVSEFEDALDIYRKAPVLIMDDLGAERVSEWANETLYSVIDYRYRTRMPTMITTNLDPYSAKNFDIRLVTRMTDKELAHVIENTAPNFRSRDRDSV